jgi:uncharacterized protein Yka (UPF0111/DUF47 family)
MMSMIEKNAELLIPIFGDIAFKANDWPDAQEVADRIKLMQPPQIAANENPQVAAVLQQSQQQMEQMQQAMGQLQQYAQQLEQQVTNKEGEINVKMAEIKRKYQEMLKDFTVDMTKLELDSQQNVPGSAV